MKVLVLGAAGGMDSAVARTAARFDFVDELAVADSNGEAAATVAGEIADNALPLLLDTGGGAALGAAVREADAVLNCVGPFFRFGVPVLQACIEAGVDYLDINDDWEPTLDMLENDGAAQEAGIRAVVGIGTSPGVSNLLRRSRWASSTQPTRSTPAGASAERAAAAMQRPNPARPWFISSTRLPARCGFGAAGAGWTSCRSKR